MSSIFGLYYRYQTIPVNLTAKIIHNINDWQADKIDYWSDKHISLGCLLLINTPQAVYETQPLHLQHCVTVADIVERSTGRGTMPRTLSGFALAGMMTLSGCGSLSLSALHDPLYRATPHLSTITARANDSQQT